MHGPDSSPNCIYNYWPYFLNSFTLRHLHINKFRNFLYLCSLSIGKANHPFLLNLRRLNESGDVSGSCLLLWLWSIIRSCYKCSSFSKPVHKASIFLLTHLHLGLIYHPARDLIVLYEFLYYLIFIDFVTKRLAINFFLMVMYFFTLTRFVIICHFTIMMIQWSIVCKLIRWLFWNPETWWFALLLLPLFLVIISRVRYHLIVSKTDWYC